MGGNFKVRCNKSDSGWLTKGKIYKVKDGVFPYDNGYKENKRFVDFEDFRSYNRGMGKKLELIEDTQSIYITTKGNETIAVLKNGKETVKIAKAKCSPSDTFSFEIGAKLAVERLFGADKSSVREVKRIAKAGEYIKIIKKGLHGPELTIGDIHKVINVNQYGNISTDKRNLFCDKEHSEYVVLENYTPPKSNMMEALCGKSEPKMPKVGDRIQVVKNGNHFPKLNIGDIHLITEIVGDYIRTDKCNSFRIGKENDEFEIIYTPCVPLSSYSNEELLEELLRREK